MKTVSGGVCAAKGYKAGGVHCGIRRNPGKKDLALIVSECAANAAAVYTTNLVKGAPIVVDQKHLADGKAQAVICNSGNANTCNADGIEIAEGMAALVEKHTGIAANDVVVASTGVIGEPLSLTPIEKGMDSLVASLSSDGSLDACHAIMTTDTVPKEIAVEFTLGGKVCRMGGIAKGSGMIHPNMATTLTFITTDADISAEMLQRALSDNVKVTLNRASVDGDTSTNDMVCVMASGTAGNPTVAAEDADFEAFSNALYNILLNLARMMAKDGEGATKLIECAVTGAADEKTAETVAKSVICSSLLKSMIFGEDANAGRIYCAVGYSDADFDISKVDIDMSSKGGSIALGRQGCVMEFDEEVAKQVLAEDEIQIIISLSEGSGTAVCWGCDLTYDYVKINGDYRS